MPHCDADHLVRDLRVPYETRHSMGRSAFTFLSALDESRLSLEGTRRLGEYRRKFHEDTPSPPRGVMGGWVGSPIGGDAASKMTDEQWLKAMTKYDTDETNWDVSTGGARELSRVLQERVTAEPSRFAQLALRMSAELHPAYGDAMLMGFGAASPTESDAVAIFDAVRHIASLGHVAHDRWLGTALRPLYKAVPLDLVALICDRAMHSADPAPGDPPIFRRQDGDARRGHDLHNNGINTARGSLAETLGDLLVYDVDGQRTELVRPHLEALAGDPVLSVRTCVAHTIAASLRHARPAAIAAFQRLIEADDYLLATDFVERLMIYIGNVNPDVIDGVIQRLLASVDDEARGTGGQLAAFAALEWNRPKLMEQALAGDAKAREGVAHVCAARLDRTSNSGLARSSLFRLTTDEDADVRKRWRGSLRIFVMRRCDPSPTCLRP